MPNLSPKIAKNYRNIDPYMAGFYLPVYICTFVRGWLIDCCLPCSDDELIKCYIFLFYDWMLQISDSPNEVICVAFSVFIIESWEAKAEISWRINWLICLKYSENWLKLILQITQKQSQLKKRIIKGKKSRASMFSFLSYKYIHLHT
jgi:hypothetical protein